MAERYTESLNLVEQPYLRKKIAGEAYLGQRKLHCGKPFLYRRREQERGKDKRNEMDE